MEYGLRRYEAVHRLAWFLFFLSCLLIAYPVARGYNLSEATSQQVPLNPEALKSTAFWMQLHWLRMPPLGRGLLYLLWVAILFVAGRFLWLVIQYVGKHVLRSLLASTVRKSPGRPKPILDGLAVSPERLFPTELLLNHVNRFPLRLLFHPFQRLRLMLSHSHATLSSEELMEKERRIVETDWQILWASWTPFRWLLWFLPLVGLVQASWLFYQHLQPALSGQRDLQEILSPILGSLLPLVQIVAVTIFFNLIAGLLKRLENLYLSNVDALLYDQFLSLLPFQSSDTLILLEAMQKHFQELHLLLRRMERERPGGLERNTANEKEARGGKG